MSLFKKEPMTLKIMGDVERLSLKPGDKVVVTWPCDLRTEHVEHFRELLAAKFVGHEVIVLSNGAKLTVLEAAK